jgi:long-chain acyl-CoA synthetase
MAAIAAMTGARLWLLSPAVLNRISDVVDQTPGSPVIFDIGSFANPPDGSRLAAEGQEDLAPERPDGSGGQPSELTASIPFTSGTTLAPKGVPLTHRNFLSDLQAVLKVMPVNPRDQFLSVLPMHHVLEFTGGFLAPLSRGATITYVERLTPKAILEAMQVTGTTVIIAVPRLCALLVRAIQAGAGSSRPWMQKASASLASLARSSQTLAKAVPLLEPGLRRLRALLCRAAHRLLGGRMRLIVSGGAALPPEIFDALDLMGFTVCEGYGLTETSPVLTFNPPERPRCGTVGRPLPGVELRIEQPDAEGVGTVLVKGPCVFSGYLGDEQATREAFCGEWFRTSDLGRLDRHGYLVLAGRADDVIVTGGGKNVYPVEIEWLYQGLPHVKEFCVVGVPDPATAGDAVHAVIVEDDNEGSPPAEVRRPEIESAVSEISRRVTTHQRIRAIHFWDGDLPRTPTLKVKRKQIQQALRELLAARQRRPMGPGS